jgi:hypothetical protein
MVHIDWRVAPDDWDRAIASCPDATFFHTDAWLRAMGAAFGIQTARTRLSWPDGRWALLPLTIRPLAKGLVPIATAGETGAYGGLVSPSPLSGDDEMAAYAAIRRRYPDLWVVGNPFATSSAPMPVVPGGESEAQSTHVLALKPFPELRAGFSRGCKARGNKARKSGMTLRVSQDPADAAVYYGLYEDTMQRWGEKLTWARPLAFYERLLAEGGPAVRLLLAEQDGRVISGLLFAAHGRVAHYVAGATLAEALPQCPSNFLMEEALVAYAAEGFETFDFGPSNGLDGVMKFKESFGAEPLAFGAQRAATGSSRLYFALRRPYDKLHHWRAHLRDARQPKSASPNPAPAGV